MEVIFQSTKDDYFDLYKDEYKKAFQKIILRVVFISLIIGFSFGFAEKEFNWNLFFIGLISTFLLLIGIWVLIPYLRSVSRIKKTIGQEETSFPNIKMTTTAEGIDLGTKKGTENLKWESIISINCIEKAVIIVLVNKKVILVPKRFFSSEIEEANFVGDIKNKISKGK